MDALLSVVPQLSDDHSYFDELESIGEDVRLAAPRPPFGC
jgi:hypothetical protein